MAAVESRPRLATVPEEIESPRAKLVFLSLATAGRSTADELAERLDMQKMALFSVLGTLSGVGVVECDGDCYDLV